MIKGSDKVYDRSEWDKPVIKQSIPLGLPERPRLYVREREPDNDPMELISRAVAKLPVARYPKAKEPKVMKYKKKKVSKRMQDEMDMMLADQVIVDSLDMIRVRRNRVLCLNCGGKRYGGGTLCIECFRSVHRILKRQLREAKWEFFMEEKRGL